MTKSLIHTARIPGITNMRHVPLFPRPCYCVFVCRWLPCGAQSEFGQIGPHSPQLFLAASRPAHLLPCPQAKKTTIAAELANFLAMESAICCCPLRCACHWNQIAAIAWPLLLSAMAYFCARASCPKQTSLQCHHAGPKLGALLAQAEFEQSQWTQCLQRSETQCSGKVRFARRTCLVPRKKREARLSQGSSDAHAPYNAQKALSVLSGASWRSMAI